MKSHEEMIEYFRSMPKKKREPNPYWKFNEETATIIDICTELQFELGTAQSLLKSVREFFRRYYESFKWEAQVLCVTPDDSKKLTCAGIPILTTGQIGSFETVVMVLPQDNHKGTSVIDESFWQNWIIDGDIKPIARIHSHHILDPYQSQIDYSTLNSGTMEMVIGKIFEEELHVCYWLDVPGTDIKAQTFLAQEKPFGGFMWISHKFHGI